MVISSSNKLRLPLAALPARRWALLAVFVACQLSFSGCFLWSSSGDSSDSDEPVEEQEAEETKEEESEAKEVKASDAPLSTEAPEPELIRLSKRLYQAGMYSVAQDSLNSLRDRYPLGAYGSWAAIKAADAYYYNGEFDKAAKFYEEFLKNYPGSPDTPYVKLQAARAHLASAKGTGRDRQPLERSLELFDQIEHDFPHTPYAVVARSERTPALNDLTAYDRFIIDFYRKKGNLEAVAAREKLFQERWGARMSAGEFKETSEEIPLEPLPELQEEPAQAPKPPAAIAAEESFETPSEIIIPESVAVQRVQCDTGDMPFAMVELSRFPEEYSAGNVLEKLEPEDGKITVPDLTVRSQQRLYSCFGDGDFSVGESGSLVLKSDNSFILTTLDNPPRILLTKIAK